MRLPRVLLLTDRSQLRLGRGLVRTIAECRQAGLTHVVLRELDLSHDRRAALAADLAATGVRVIAAHRDLPAADGVQQPTAGCGDEAGRLLGRSAHTRAEAERAAADGAAYVTLGPYATTASKPGYGPLLPDGAFTGLPVPAYALGGITPENIGEALAEGAHGVAVMGAVMRAADPARVIAELLGRCPAGAIR
ncbi:thiamine phosphate synthase [Nocardioides insulae]|uniref:thiamine phosphate synthase n=1 Tax=Nocardioides insulae TaxID=394734 RepID=UPI0004141943|nr:thiamine phosphate synthase [Nocardioides insulae]